jgi:hemoglobin/transferrin/lactoferrin receptor protein
MAGPLRRSLLAPLVPLVALTLSLGATPARAEDKPSSSADAARGLEARVASGTTERVFDSPREISVVTAKSGRERLVDDVPGLLEETPGVALVWPSPAGGSPVLRGLLGRRVPVFVDGVRLTTALAPLGPAGQLATVDLFSLSRVEILRGSGAVLHGADAVGGVLSLKTHTPSFDPWRAWDASGGALGRFTSASSGLLTHAYGEGHVRGLGLRLGGTLRRYDDLTAGRDLGEQPFTRFWDGSVDVHGVWYIDRRTTLRATYAALRRHDAPDAARSTPRDFSVLRDQHRDLVTLRLGRESDSRWLRELTATVSFQHQRELRERLRLDADNRSRRRDGVISIGGKISGRSELPYDNQLVYGVDVYHDIVSSTAEDERISEPLRTPRARGRYLDDAKLTQLGVFIRDRLLLADRRLAISAGGRLTSWWFALPADPLGSPAFDHTLTDVSGSVHLRYLLGDGLNLHAGLTRAVRAPNLDDYTARGCGDQAFELAPAELSRERSLGAEAGVRVDLFGNLRGGVSYFFTHLDDPIVLRRVPGGALESCGGAAVPLARRSNADSAQIHGVEADLRLTLGAHISLFAWVSWARGTVDLGDGASEPLSRVAPLSGLAGVRYQEGKRWFAELAVRWATRQDRLSELDLGDRRICPAGAAGCEGTPGYAVLRLRGGLQLAKPLSLTLAVDNLTNQPYRSHGSGIDAAGIDARVGLELAL